MTARLTALVRAYLIVGTNNKIQYLIVSILNSKNFEAFNGKENVHFPVPVSPWDLSLIENKMRLWWAVFVLLKVDIKMVHFHSLWLQGERIRILWCSYWRPRNQETVLVPTGPRFKNKLPLRLLANNAWSFEDGVRLQVSN